MSTTPPSDELRPASSAELLFPHIASGLLAPGSTYTTQFALISGTAGASPAGTVRFFGSDASRLSLALARNPLEGMGQLVRVKDGFTALEGPQWIPWEESLLFVDNRTNSIHRLTAPDTVTIFSIINGPFALALDELGRLLIAGNGRVNRLQADGSLQTIASTFANDLVVRSDGIVYFTSGPVDRIGRDGVRTRVWLPPAGEGANGIALSPDQSILYISTGNRIRAFDLGNNGALSNERILTMTGGSTDGMTVDREGNIFLTTNQGVQVFSPHGQLWGTIPVPRPAVSTMGWYEVTNCAFGGANATTLYITGQQAIFRIELVIPGVY